MATLKTLKPLTWVRNPGRFADGSLLKMGNVTVAATNRAVGSKSEPDAPLWMVDMRLPGIRMKPDANGANPRHHTEDEVKAAAERLVAIWFTWVTEAE